jgi:hypothetical protein
MQTASASAEPFHESVNLAKIQAAEKGEPAIRRKRSSLMQRIIVAFRSQTLYTINSSTAPLSPGVDVAPTPNHDEFTAPRSSGFTSPRGKRILGAPSSRCFLRLLNTALGSKILGLFYLPGARP